MTDENKSIRDQIASTEARLKALDQERDYLSRHLAMLKNLLVSTENSEFDDRNSSRTIAPRTTTPLTSAEKIALFMDLFRGRADVYPKRWVNTKKNTKGYSPACSNEWTRGLCDKKKVKCGECTNQAFIPVTEQTIHDHLKGRHIIGVYPMLQDETCWFLAVDFDKGKWQDDVAVFAKTCKDKGVPFAVERSRSGNGAHVWFFFTDPVSVSIARKMGCFLITETMATRHELPMTSYDRFFPNQDTMPKGGFGNLIALPFQDGPRQKGSSVFVDEEWIPFPDQWVFLASVRRMTPDEVESLANEALRKGQVTGVQMGESVDDSDESTPWTRPPSRKRPKPVISGPLPAQVNAVLSQRLFVEIAGLPSQLINQIKRLAAFQNPEFYKKQAMRLPTAMTSRVISCFEEYPKHVALPRGCTDDLDELLAEFSARLSLEDQRTVGHDLDVDFHGELTPIQEQVVQAVTDHDIGVFVAPPGSGKTVVGANLVSRRKRNTLILVHRTQLLEQWIAQLALFLDMKRGDIGQIGAGKRKPNGSLDVAMVQSLVKKDAVNDIVATYGHVIVDECHHASAVSYERVLKEVKARYITGLTATPLRRDGHHPIMRFQLGPTRFTIDAKSQTASRSIDHRLIVRNTDFQLSEADANKGIQEIYGLLAEDERRNRLILEDVVQALAEKRSPILLTERRDHLEYLAERLRGFTRNLIVLKGGMKTKERRSVIARLVTIPETEERLVLATGRFIGEGFDDARLDTLFLALPVSWRGTLVQYAGRLHRKYHAKTEVRVMDYVDHNAPVLAKMFKKRMRGYRAMGYSVADYDEPEEFNDDYTIEYDQETLREINEHEQ